MKFHFQTYKNGASNSLRNDSATGKNWRLNREYCTKTTAEFVAVPCRQLKHAVHRPTVTLHDESTGVINMTFRTPDVRATAFSARATAFSSCSVNLPASSLVIAWLRALSLLTDLFRWSPKRVRFVQYFFKGSIKSSFVDIFLSVGVLQITMIAPNLIRAESRVPCFNSML
jgi:hypothetical protein